MCLVGLGCQVFFFFKKKNSLFKKILGTRCNCARGYEFSDFTKPRKCKSNYVTIRFFKMDTSLFIPLCYILLSVHLLSVLYKRNNYRVAKCNTKKVIYVTPSNPAGGMGICLF